METADEAEDRDLPVPPALVHHASRPRTGPVIVLA